MISRLDAMLIFALGFIISASVMYEVDGGLKASLFCLQDGESAECFRMMELAH